MIKVGEHVTYVDEVAVPHQALVTAVHGEFYESDSWTQGDIDAMTERIATAGKYDEDRTKELKANYSTMLGKPHTIPSINVVYVSSDKSQTDSYGRQIVRQTSTVHQSGQTAHGRYWFV